MIKNIIFDLDNTIIKDEEEDALFYKDVLKKYGYDENDYLAIYNSIDRYESSRSEERCFYDKKEMLDFINKDLNRNYDIKVIDGLADAVGKHWTKRVLLKENIVKELAQRYNLYVYTNFFEEAQKQRIECIGYMQYFKRIFGADMVGVKPLKKCMENLLKEINSKPDECIMIGDTKKTDILCANSVGMKSILYDYNGKRDKKEIFAENYIVIKDFEELLEIL